ncbi:MAG: hypothetical protein D6770_09695 [Anaerolineae bacterium]|nr:MAG: hypothetical protein D6770_09695 [Anaerolineae bacterium]
MLSASDFIRLPYTPDLTKGGIAYACRSLHYTYNRMGGSTISRLRRIVGGVAVELAFRRTLGELGVPFDVLGATPFTDPDRYDVALGGRRCDIKSFLITRREQIRALRQDPTLLLQAPALVPFDQVNAEGHSDEDLYIFAFTTALVTSSRTDLEKALAAGQPIHLIHAMPKGWARPRLWRSLGRLALKSEDGPPLELELGGQNAAREFISCRVSLPPRQRVEIEVEFYALAYLHPSALPHGRVGIHSPTREETYIIPPYRWGNIWVYGMDILLTGYITRAEFRRRARKIPAGSRVYQYNRTRTKNLAVPVEELRPLGELLARVKAWEAGRHPG